jgi:nitrogenase-associated protein
LPTVVFYQKPGCGTNTRQKQMLEAAGHTVIARDLLAEPWTAERLREFFGSMPVASWFNPAAPAVKSGSLDLDEISEQRALEMMLKEPLLICRPLIEVGEQKCAGFAREPVVSLLGARNRFENAESCSCPLALMPCPDPRKTRTTSTS